MSMIPQRTWINLVFHARLRLVLMSWLFLKPFPTIFRCCLFFLKAGGRKTNSPWMFKTSFIYGFLGERVHWDGGLWLFEHLQALVCCFPCSIAILAHHGDERWYNAGDDTHMHTQKCHAAYDRSALTPPTPFLLINQLITFFAVVFIWSLPPSIYYT